MLLFVLHNNFCCYTFVIEITNEHKKTVGQFARLNIYHQPQIYDSFSSPPKE